jgi:hypothetical protein
MDRMALLEAALVGFVGLALGPTAGGAASAPLQEPYHFDSHHQAAPGVIGSVHLQLGQHTFYAAHGGTGNFIVYLNTPDGPEVAFNEMASGRWTWNYQCRREGDFTIDVKAADGEWMIEVQ